jgi:glutamate/tyrosine decarboxylase-like PLP-dependent enzyme
MEKEAVAEIAAMFGWGTHLGHLTSGGTMANLEALWVAGLLAPGKTVLASEQAHYTHARVSAVLALSFESVAVDERGRMDVEALEQRLTGGDVGTVVATLGTTGTGAVDPLSEILSLQQRYGFRLHVDAAYGGYYRLVEGLENDVAAAFRALDSVDSIVVDPHKHGLQPYGCGCILFRDPAVGRFYKHESPYTYFSSDELHLGEISLECSRPGAAAVALWATHRLLPLVPGGEFARDLGKCRQAAVELHQRLASDPRFLTPVEPDLDIFVWAPAGSSASEVSVRSRALFTAAARRNLHLATFDYPTRLFQSRYPQLEADRPAVTCLRSCLMKPEHLDWLDEIWRLLSEAMEDVGTG